MSQFPHDEFVKQYIPALVEDYGMAKDSQKIRSQIKEIDVFFQPTTTLPTSPETLGLLGKLAQTTCLFEVYRNPVTADEINECLGKLVEVKTELKRVKRKDKSGQLSPKQAVKLWILTPTLSTAILNSFATKPRANGPEGVYLLGPALDTGIVVIHQLPRNRETLWLRILGKGKVQENAIDELKALPAEYPHRENVLELISNLYVILEAKKEEKQTLTTEDEALIMKLSPIYEKKLAQSRQEGIQQGIREGIQQGIQEGIQQGIEQEATLIVRLLKIKVGDLPTHLETRIMSLPLSQLEELGEALLSFNSLNDLIQWLNNMS